MSHSNCPIPNFDQYEIGRKFEGYVLSHYNRFEKLFYVLNRKHLEDFEAMENCKPTRPCPEIPPIGKVFMYKSKNGCCYRAHRLHAVQEKYAIRAFLYDYGEVIHRSFLSRICFMTPEKFWSIPALAVFCQLASSPTLADGDFDNAANTGEMFSFVIQDKIRNENELGSNEKCLVVRMEPSGENALRRMPKANPVEQTRRFHIELSDQPNFDFLTFPADRFTMKDLPRLELPAADSLILIRVADIISPSSFYAHIIKEPEYKIKLPLMEFQILMNRSDSLRNYKMLSSMPKVGDLVMAPRDVRWQRGLVLEVANEFCNILFIDFGALQRIAIDELCELPEEFASFPAQSIQCLVEDLQPFDDKNKNTKAISIMRQIFDPFAQAQVSQFYYVNHQVKMIAKVYNMHGFHISDIFDELMQPPPVSPRNS